jgi:hypothetical protein
MLNEPADRHVLAAAVASDAERIVTTNVRHFPAAACEPFGIEVVHPDVFLCELYQHAPAKVRVALAEQAAALSRPPLTEKELPIGLRPPRLSLSLWCDVLSERS